MTTLTVSTRRAMFEQLESLGVVGHAREAVLQETAELRHRQRVKNTVGLAMGAAEALNLEATVPTALLLLAMDAAGVGGAYGGTEGLGTRRMVPFNTLGSGRRQAADGPAYEAARLYAMYRLVGADTAHQSVFEIRPAEGGIRASMICFTQPEATSRVDFPLRELLPDWRAFAYTLVREGMRASLLMDLRTSLGDYPVIFAGSPTEWSALVGQVHELCQAEEEAPPPPAELLPEMEALRVWLISQHACQGRMEAALSHTSVREAWDNAQASDLRWLVDREVGTVEALYAAIGRPTSEEESKRLLHQERLRLEKGIDSKDRVETLSAAKRIAELSPGPHQKTGIAAWLFQPYPGGDD